MRRLTKYDRSSQALKAFKSQRPKWIDPEEFLAPQFQNLFDLSFFPEGTMTIPTGWQSVTEGNAYPRLSTRQPKPIMSDVEMQSPGAWANSDASGSDEVNEVTRMAEESSDDDSDFPHQVKVRFVQTDLWKCCADLHHSGPPVTSD